MAKTGEAVSPKMIPVVQGIVDWIEAHILDTLPVSTIAKKSGYSHWYFQRAAGHHGELRQSAKNDHCDNLFNADASVDTEYFSVPGIRRTGRFLPDLSPSLWYVAHPLSSGSAGQGDEYAVSFDGRRERRAGEAVCRRSGRPGSANGFRRHDATSANIMANPVILAQGGDLYITTCAW